MRARLLRRTGHGVALTPAGAEFHSFAQETLASFERTQQRIIETEGATPDQLTLSVPLRLGRLLIPVLHRKFASALPDMTLHVHEEASDRAPELMQSGQIDAMITYAPCPSPDSRGVPLASESLYAVGTKDLLGTASIPIRLSEIGQMELLTPHKGNYRKLLKSSLSAHGIHMKIARELETAEGLLAFAAEGDGVAILPMSNVYQEYERGEVMVRPIVSPEIERILVLYPSPTMNRHTLDVVLPIVRGSISKVATLADWKTVRKNGGVAKI